METAGASHPPAPGAHRHQRGLRGDAEGGSCRAALALRPLLPVFSHHVAIRAASSLGRGKQPRAILFPSGRVRQQVRRFGSTGMKA
ncbi:hypothetical protein P7K49_013212 [Saguinus oedipus]|uniref:Uncharacterized protein n=1 Tax=Saguinus oedipus TaxID=9490 RepID=A0ABQ9VFA3_SAGOE|nr:hypothetical protein P7K49_013212 [Saguinus oedipus]